MIEKIIEGKIYFHDHIEECCLGIDEQGRISEIKKILTGDNKIKIKRGIVLPAAVDIHVHFRDPGMTYKEDFSSGSLAAAYGGVSCVIDMPNNYPPVTTISSLKGKLAIARMKSYVDFGIYAAITDKNIPELEKLSRFTRYFKIYLGETTGELYFDMEKMHVLEEKLKEIETEIILAFHAEDKNCLERYRTKAKNLKEYARSRPPICERNAINKILHGLSDTSARIHICHVSSVDTIHGLEHRNKNITCGVTPHHLLFNTEQELKPETYFKVNPPIRNRLHQEILLNTLLEGIIDVIESDHAPHSMDEKQSSFEEAPAGMPGVETMYPVLLHYFVINRYPLSKLVEKLCKRPAKIFGLKKGKIEVGMDADFAVFDIKDVKKIRYEDLHSKCGYTPYEGIKAIFPRTLFIRGEPVIEDGECVSSRGYGMYVGESDEERD